MEKGLIGVQMMMVGGKVREIGAYAVLQKLSELGFHCIEVSQVPMTPENVAGMKKACKDFDIKIAALSAALEGPGPNDALATQFDKIVADCKMLNCKYLRIGMLPISLMGDKEKTMAFVERAEEMAHRLAEHDIDLYYHNHHVEFEKFDGKYMMDIIRDNTSKLGFELDVFWIHRGGENPLTYIPQFAGRIKLIHLKDYRIKFDTSALSGEFNTEKFRAAFNGAVQFAEVGEGSLPMKQIIDTGLSCGSEYFLIEQDDSYGRDPFDCLATSRDNLIKLGYQDWFSRG